MQGKIIKLISNDYTVQSSGEKYICKARGKFRKLGLSPVVGDEVIFSKEDKYILEILPRKNELDRPAIANVDMAVIITSLKKPDFSSNLLDKLLVICEYNKVKPVIIFTKYDLLNEEEKTEIKPIITYYQKIGYEVYINDKIEKIKTIFKNKVAVFTGQSGAGKSTLLNKLNPDLNLKTNEISLALNRGKHTTRHTELIEICDGLVADTPGFSALEFTGMDKSDIRDNFTEFNLYRDECQFRDCFHIREQKCMVKDKVADGTILKSRYENYINFTKWGDWMVKIAGSFLKIQEEEEKIKNLNDVCDMLHFDVMDGKFTENPTKPLEEMLKRIPKKIKPFDVHLMVYDLEKYIDIVSSIHPEYVTFHAEATDNIPKIINYIHGKGLKAGIAINPTTSTNLIKPYLNDIDLVLVMSVPAGAGGQTFIDITDKIDDLIKYREEEKLSFLIEVDGGINDRTIKLVKKADIVVAGSYITNADNYLSQIYKLKKSLRNGFTLAELLGVIVILSIIGMVAVTAIDKNLKQSRYDTCIAQETNLIEGAKMLVTDYPNILPTTSNPTVTIDIKTLQEGGTINGQTISAGYVESDLINPMTEETYASSESGVSVVITTTNGTSYSYEVVYGDEDESCHT